MKSYVLAKAAVSRGSHFKEISLQSLIIESRFRKTFLQKFQKLDFLKMTVTACANGAIRYVLFTFNLLCAVSGQAQVTKRRDLSVESNSVDR